MLDDFEIKKFIMANRAEVMDVCLTEYNESETMEMFRLEGWLEGFRESWLEGFREGWQEGFREGQREIWLLSIQNLMDSTGWTADHIMEILKIPQDQRAALYANLSKNV